MSDATSKGSLAIGELVLVRHGETEWSLSGQHTGRSDPPLLEQGRRQAEGLRARLSGFASPVVASSPAKRALETAVLAGYGEIARVIDALTEWDYGDYEGRTTSEIRRSRPGWRLFRDGCPNGEALLDVAARARSVLSGFELGPGAPGCLMIFSHGHLLRVLATCFLGIEPADAEHLSLAPASVSVLGFEHEVRVVRLWNARLGTGSSDAQGASVGA